MWIRSPYVIGDKVNRQMSDVSTKEGCWMNLISLHAVLGLLGMAGAQSLAEYLRQMRPDAGSNIAAFFDKAIVGDDDRLHAADADLSPVHRIRMELGEPNVVPAPSIAIIQQEQGEEKKPAAQRTDPASAPPAKPETSPSTNPVSHPAQDIASVQEENDKVEQPEAPRVEYHGPASPDVVTKPRMKLIPDEKLAEFIPDALKFTEPLASWIHPGDVVVMTGGDSPQRRLEGYPKLSADSIQAFCDYHGYGLAFLDQLDYGKNLMYCGVQFRPEWHRVFGLPEIRKRWPKAKYVVWFDDDILVPYPETHMLNHYINLMEADPEWEMTYAEEGADYVLNSGMFIMKARDFAYNTYQRALDVGLEDNNNLANNFGHEQGAIITLRERGRLAHSIRVIRHRQGMYNFNNFARDCGHDPQGAATRPGDAFVHFTGQFWDMRIKMMKKLIESVAEWRRNMSPNFTLPPPSNRHAV